VIKGEDWVLNRFFFGGSVETATKMTLRQTMFEITPESPYTTVSNLVPEVPITVRCPRATAIGTGVGALLPWNEETKSVTFTTTGSTSQTFVAFGQPGTQNVLWKVPAQDVQGGASTIITLSGGEDGLVDVMYDDVGIVAIPGILKAVLAGRSGDVWLYSLDEAPVTLRTISVDAKLDIEVIYEETDDGVSIRAVAGDTAIPFSWGQWTSVEGVAALATELKVTLPDDFTFDDIWADTSGVLGVRKSLVATGIHGKKLNPQALFEIPAERINSVKIVNEAEKNKKGLTKGAYGGIAAAAAVVLVGAIVGIVLFRRSRRSGQDTLMVSLAAEDSGAVRGSLME
jgi:hypothetical protein